MDFLQFVREITRIVYEITYNFNKSLPFVTAAMK